MCGNAGVFLKPSIEDVERMLSKLSHRGPDAQGIVNRWGYHLPNKEALYYYRILHEHFQDRWIFPTMGRSRSL